VLALAVPPAFQFSGYYVQKVFHWSPGQYSLMVIIAGAFGIIGNVAAGHMADRWGRRIAGAVLLSGFPLAAMLFYLGPERTLWPAWVGLVFCSGGGRLIVRALSTELFPTSQRGSASGVFTTMEMLGAGIGMLCIYFFGTEDVSDLAHVIPTIASLAWLSALALSRFPETSGKELEALSDDS
jgi:predicted MFS family arabinose efflux permease